MVCGLCGRALSSLSAAENLSASNICCAIRWASEGRYGNALQALGSLVAVSFDNASAKEEIVRRHLPTPSPSVPPLLNMQPSIVLSALCTFLRAISPGSSALHPQHLLDAVCGSTIYSCIS